MGLTIGTDTRPWVFFVHFAAALGKKVAEKGLTLDAASRASTFGELNAETQSAQRSEEEGMRLDLEGRVERNIGNISRCSYRLSIGFLITELVFEWGWRKLKDFKVLGGGRGN
jgi:hypothetical protein